MTHRDRALPSLRALDDGMLVKVRAAPGAARDRVIGLHDDALKIAVRAPPEKGKANQAITRLVAAALGLKPVQVSIHSGGTSRDKWLRVEGISVETLERRLREALE